MLSASPPDDAKERARRPHPSLSLHRLLDFGLDDKAHVTEGQCQILLNNEPILVFIVDSEALFETEIYILVNSL